MPRPLLLSLASLFEDDSRLDSRPGPPEYPAARHNAHRFFLEAGVVSHFAKLHESHELVNTLLDRPLGWVPGFASPREYYDMRRSGQLFTASAAVGCTVNDWLELILEGGGWSGDMTDRSAPLFITNLDTRFQYTLAYGQLGTRIYPLGRPEDSDRGGLWPLRQARPFLYQALGLTHVASVGTGRASLRGFPELLTVRISRSDWTVHCKLGAGVEIPLGERLSAVVLGGYGFFADKQDEFNGFSITAALRFRL